MSRAPRYGAAQVNDQAAMAYLDKCGGWNANARGMGAVKGPFIIRKKPFPLGLILTKDEVDAAKSSYRKSTSESNSERHPPTLPPNTFRYLTKTFIYEVLVEEMYFISEVLVEALYLLKLNRLYFTDLHFGGLKNNLV